MRGQKTQLYSLEPPPRPVILFRFLHTFSGDSSSSSSFLSFRQLPLSFQTLLSCETSTPFLLSICISVGECTRNDDGDGDKEDGNYNGHGCDGHSMCSVTWMTHSKPERRHFVKMSGPRWHTGLFHKVSPRRIPSVRYCQHCPGGEIRK